MVAADYKLKDRLGPAVPVEIAGWISSVYSSFDASSFVTQATSGLADLELMARARHVAYALSKYLPPGTARALNTLTDSLPPIAEPGEPAASSGLALFCYVEYVSAYGLPAFDESMSLQYGITKRLTAELSIRTFIENEYERTMRQLGVWVNDDSEHVRRLVSEGTRPRLPWAPRLRRFQSDPSPILPLLDQLKDDPSEYVRRSVANNLNDIGKDHPDVLLVVASSWYGSDATRNRKRLVQRALRSMVKGGNREALAILGFSPNPAIVIDQLTIDPAAPRIGQSIIINSWVRNSGGDEVAVLTNLEIGFVKANGTTTAKVFKGAQFTLGPGAKRHLTKKVSLAQHSTRTHYAGEHTVSITVNGVMCGSVGFELSPA
jgi:3-methyladenine DNA glycosylase AlkC